PSGRSSAVSQVVKPCAAATATGSTRRVSRSSVYCHSRETTFAAGSSSEISCPVSSVTETGPVEALVSSAHDADAVDCVCASASVSVVPHPVRARAQIAVAEVNAAMDRRVLVMVFLLSVDRRNGAGWASASVRLRGSARGGGSSGPPMQGLDPDQPRVLVDAGGDG